MVADWIVIYAGFVVLAAAVAGDVPPAQRPRFEVSTVCSFQLQASRHVVYGSGVISASPFACIVTRR